jgi:hypothetical protein
MSKIAEIEQALTLQAVEKLGEQRSLIKQMDDLLARAADALNCAPTMKLMDLGCEISNFRRSNPVKK